MKCDYSACVGPFIDPNSHNELHDLHNGCNTKILLYYCNIW